MAMVSSDGIGMFAESGRYVILAPLKVRLGEVLRSWFQDGRLNMMDFPGY